MQLGDFVVVCVYVPHSSQSNARCRGNGGSVKTPKSILYTNNTSTKISKWSDEGMASSKETKTNKILINILNIYNNNYNGYNKICNSMLCEMI